MLKIIKCKSDKSIEKQALQKELELRVEAAESQILSLESEKKTLSEEIERLQGIINHSDEEINKQKQELERINAILTESTNSLNTERQRRFVLEDDNRTLKDENERMVNKTIAVISELIRFCDLLKSMRDTSTNECVNILKAKINQTIMEYSVSVVSEASGVFDSTCQKIVDIQETDDLAIDNYVSRVVRPGYWYAGKCIVPQDVIVFSLKK